MVKRNKILFAVFITIFTLPFPTNIIIADQNNLVMTVSGYIEATGEGLGLVGSESTDETEVYGSEAVSIEKTEVTRNGVVYQYWKFKNPINFAKNFKNRSNLKFIVPSECRYGTELLAKEDLIFDLKNELSINDQNFSHDNFAPLYFGMLIKKVAPEMSPDNLRCHNPASFSISY